MRSKFALRRMRSVNVTIATTMLAVPASAFALTTATASQPSATPTATTTAPLPVRVTPRHVAFGDPVNVTGSAPALARGQKVLLESRAGRLGAWRRMAWTLAGSRGGFAFHVHLRHSVQLRAVAAAGDSAPASPVAVAAHGAGAAPARVDVRSRRRVTPVTVAAVMHTTTPDRQLLAGQAMQVIGRLAPARAGRTVRLQGHSAAGWTTLTRSRTGRRGRFALRYAPSTTGIGRHLRVMFSGDRANARSVGPAGAMSVFETTVASWYDDGGSTACGFHAGLGVANRSLPCGTKVQFRYAGRTVTATVDDRGPYVGGRTWDLNQNTAAALHFAGVGTVWSTS